MKCNKQQLKRFLQEEEILLKRMAAMVPKEREDYPLMQSELDTIKEISRFTENNPVAAATEWMRKEKRECEDALKKDPENFTLIGRNVVLDECILWIKKDHTPVINDIYLP